mmetsp:Transcript_76818/g.217379  ORF Transcript_76818/g.217379 Transcript_76818/m.217379 type:complete len:247 (-) Transcript_76818:159-899(-)
MRLRQPGPTSEKLVPLASLSMRSSTSIVGERAAPPWAVASAPTTGPLRLTALSCTTSLLPAAATAAPAMICRSAPPQSCSRFLPSPTPSSATSPCGTSSSPAGRSRACRFRDSSTGAETEPDAVGEKSSDTPVPALRPPSCLSMVIEMLMWPVRPIQLAFHHGSWRVLSRRTTSCRFSKGRRSSLHAVPVCMRVGKVRSSLVGPLCLDSKEQPPWHISHSPSMWMGWSPERARSVVYSGNSLFAKS